MEPFTLQHSVAFSETDAAGIVHFSNYYRWMENAEAAFLKSLGMSILSLTGRDRYGFPKVMTRCEFKGPLRYGDTVNITLHLIQMRSSALRYHFRFHKAGSGASNLTAEGEMVTTYAYLEPDTLEIRAEIIPDNLRARLEPYLQSE